MSRLSAWTRWQKAAGPWVAWAMCPILTMPGAPPLTSSTCRARLDLSDLLVTGGTAVLLDVDPALGVRTAAEASRQGLAQVVLVLPRWPYADAVLPAGELLAALQAASREVRTSSADNVIFVLDGERQRSIRRPAHDARIDNRYALAASELPNLATLRRAGIRRVVKVVAPR